MERKIMKVWKAKERIRIEAEVKAEVKEKERLSNEEYQKSRF